MSRHVELCSFFISGGCSRGADCSFSHDLVVHAPHGVDVSGGFILSGNVVNHHLAQRGTPPSPPPQPEELDYPVLHDRQQVPCGPAWAGPPLSSRKRLNVNAQEYVPPPPTGLSMTPSVQGEGYANKWQASNLFGLSRQSHSPPPEDYYFPYGAGQADLAAPYDRFPGYDPAALTYMTRRQQAMRAPLTTTHRTTLDGSTR